MKRQTRPMRVGLWLVAVMALGLAALTAGGCGGSEDAAGSGDLKTYSSSEYRYSLQYPGNWRVEEGASLGATAGGAAAGNVGIYNPDGTVAGDAYIDLIQIAVYELGFNVDTSNMPEIKAELEVLLSGLEGQSGDLQPAEPLTETSVNGLEGFKTSYSFNESGVPVRSTAYFLFAGSLQYQLTVQAAQEDFATYKPIFDAMVASFRQTG